MFGKKKRKRYSMKEKCDFHDSIEATYICRTCGKSICRYCERNHRIPHQCPECITDYVMGKRFLAKLIAILIVGGLIASVVVLMLLPENDYRYSSVHIQQNGIYIGIEDGSYNLTGDGSMDLEFRIYLRNWGNIESGQVTLELIAMENGLMKAYANSSVESIEDGITVVVTIKDFNIKPGTYRIDFIIWKESASYLSAQRTLAIQPDEVTVSETGKTDYQYDSVMGMREKAPTELCLMALIVIIPVVFLVFFSRLSGPKVLDNSVRHLVYGHIKNNPGVHFRAIMRELNLNNSTLTHHLATLEREGFVKAAKDGIYKRYFPNNLKEEDNPVRVSATQNYILNIIREMPGISQKDIAAILNLTSQTVNYHIDQMRKANVLDVKRNGKSTQLFLSELT